MLPLVSIIIPVYNVKDFLCESIDSAIHQTYQNLEIIIIDDGSTDGSGKICDEYQSKDNRIHVIHQVNKGLSGARNTGLDHMHGDYVAFLDSDDAFLPEMIETMVKESIRNSADIVVCGFYRCKTTEHMAISQAYKTSRPKQQLTTSQTALKYLIDNRISINVWSKLYKRSIFDGSRFLEGYNHEDLILTPYLIEKADKVMILEAPFVLYRNRENNITSSVNEKNINDWLYAIRLWEEFAEKRTPDIFSPEDLNRIREINVRWLLGKKLLIHSMKRNSMSASLSAVEDKIRFYSERADHLSTKIRVYSFFVNTMPGLTFRLMSGYYSVKNVIDRKKTESDNKKGSNNE